MSSRAPTTRSQVKSTSVRKSESWIPSQNCVLDSSKIWPVLVTGLALLTIITVSFLKYHKELIRVPRLTSVTDRLVHALQLEAYALLPLFLSLVLVMMARVYHGAFNPLRTDDHKFASFSKILTNTVEHTILFTLSHLTFVTLISADQIHFSILFTLLWTVGRILFTIGYSIHPKYRSIGFIISFLPNALVVLWNLGQVSGLSKSLPVVSIPNFKVEL